MVDLHLLKRTDCELLHCGRSSNAGSFAAALASGHAFEVQIAALYPGLGAKLPEVQRRMKGHVRNGWHRAGLHDALGALAAALTPQAATAFDAATEPTQAATPAPAGPAQEEPGQASDAAEAAMETDAADKDADNERVRELRKHLEPCPYFEADKVTTVAQALRARLGNEVAARLLQGAKQSVLKDSCGKKRKVLKEGCPKGKAWRVRR